jgi:hypothetical protein
MFTSRSSFGASYRQGLKMVTSLSKLAALIQDGSVPAWMRETVTAKREEILNALERNQPYTLTGPLGEEVIIQRADKTAAAA